MNEINSFQPDVILLYTENKNIGQFVQQVIAVHYIIVFIWINHHTNDFSQHARSSKSISSVLVFGQDFISFFHTLQKAFQFRSGFKWIIQGQVWQSADRFCQPFVLVCKFENVANQCSCIQWNFSNRWFSRYVIAVMLVDINRRSFISSFCSSTSICSFHHR